MYLLVLYSAIQSVLLMANEQEFYLIFFFILTGFFVLE